MRKLGKEWRHCRPVSAITCGCWWMLCLTCVFLSVCVNAGRVCKASVCVCVNVVVVHGGGHGFVRSKLMAPDVSDSFSNSF